ncbi:hypothetical protein BX600DRAFT_369627, partial [Xylariales sp. PMI_506]
DASFSRRQSASDRREWCEGIPLECKVEMVQRFWKAFQNTSTMPTVYCALCQVQKSSSEVRLLDWRQAVPEELREVLGSVLDCSLCFPMESERGSVRFCVACVGSLGKKQVPSACMGRTLQIGCEHRYPAVLRDLTALEEKLLALNTAYGYITKINVQGDGSSKTRQSSYYRKHVSGHITVFPNNVESLASEVLPHPLVSALEYVHIIWAGAQKPSPQDVNKLLRVRPPVLRAALVWLCANNPLYASVRIDEVELAAWRFEEGTDVPRLVYDRMVREEANVGDLI